MFILKKILTPFILPPGCLVVLCLFFGIVFLMKRKRGLGLFGLAAGMIFWGASIQPVSDFFTADLEAGFRMPKEPKGDVIVVLCGGLEEGAPDLTGIDRPSDQMTVRIVTAARLYRKLRLPIVVTGGRVFESRVSEAVVARRFLADLGVNPEHVLMEERSRDTYENAKYTAEILNRNRFSRVLLVTDGVHMKRAAACFHSFQVSVTPVPSSLDSQSDRPYTWLDFMPGDYEEISDAIHEIVGWMYYRWAYGLE